MLRFMRVPAAIIALGMLVLAAMHAGAVAPGNPAFQARWERTDDPVLSGQVSRTWIWGPEANSQVMNEPYQESPGGQRQVQYYDKSRMEINNPNGDPNNLFYVTNGLLVVELMSGNLQKGDDSFEQHNPAIVNVAGDSDDPTGPTYVTMAALRNLPALGDNALITQRVNRAGVVTNDQSLAAQNVRTAQRLTVPGIDHQIAAPFWEFMNSSGLVKSNGQYVNEALFTNPYYATGFPITEAYWASVKVANTYRDVLMQCFERRCLTYTPGNPAGFATEAGNVGQHYRTWRYVQIPGEGGATATSTSTSTSGNPTATGEASATSTAVPVTNYVFAAKFGQPTDAANDMTSPTGVVLDGDGNLYVADGGRGRVQKFDPNGVLLFSFGDAAGPGKLTSTGGIEIAPSGNICVVDPQAHVIQIYQPDGDYVGTFGSGAGSADGQFSFPTDIAFDSAGNLFVVDGGNARIQVFDDDGDFVYKWGTLGELPTEFDLPTGIAIDANDDVYVTDQNNNRVQVFDAADGMFLRQWGTPGLADGNFNSPFGIAIAPDTSLVYVTETGNHRVQVFTTTGDFVAGWGEIGAGPGQFAQPLDVVVGNDARIFVADTNNSRVQIYSTLDQSYISKIDGDSRGRFGSGEVDGVAINPDNGDIIVIDYGANLVKTFKGDGTFATEWGDIAPDPQIPLDNPNDLAIGPNGLFYIADGNNDRVVVFNAAGQQQFEWGGIGTADGKFDFPTGIAIDSAGNVYVTDGNNNRVQKFDANGQYLDQWGGLGTADGKFTTPIDVHVHGVHVYVTDANNDRVQVFDLDGNYETQFGDSGLGDGEFFHPWRVTTDAAGYIYVTDSLNNRVQKFTPDGQYLAQFGTQGGNDGQFNFPTGIAIRLSGDIVVADQDNARVQIFSPVP